MAKICTTEKTTQRQRWIEDGLLELMLQTKYEDITVAQLCRHLQLPRRSFYRYFRDMDDILDSLLNHTFQDLALCDQPPDTLEIQKAYEFWFQHRQLLDALSRSGLLDKLYEYTVRYTDPQSIGQYLNHNALEMDISREASLFIITGFISLVIAWHGDGFRKSPSEMAQIAWRFMFSPILTIP